MAADGLKSLIDMNSRLRDSVLPAIEKFVQEREKLGEYDTSAVAIIELSKIVLDLSQYVRAHVRAQLDIAISE